MERSIFAAIFGGFLGILALGGLAFPPLWARIRFESATFCRAHLNALATAKAGRGLANPRSGDLRKHFGVSGGRSLRTGRRRFFDFGRGFGHRGSPHPGAWLRRNGPWP